LATKKQPPLKPKGSVTTSKPPFGGGKTHRATPISFSLISCSIKCIAPNLGPSGKGLNAIIVIHITTATIKDFNLNNSYAQYRVNA
jgi:hypothetical protein